MHFDIYVPEKTVMLTMNMYFEFHLRNWIDGGKYFYILLKSVYKSVIA